QFVRGEMPDPTDDDDDLPRTAASYRVLDRDPGLVASADLSPENIAHILGDLAIFDAHEAEPARAFVSGLGPEIPGQVTASFSAVAGDLARAEGEPREHGFVRTEQAPLVMNWYFPGDIARPKLNELLKLQRRHVIEEVWPDTAQEALGGKTPREASQSPELKAALAASVVELDVFCEKNG